MINILLTGAGFTANFGSPLAKDIYNILFNTHEVQNEVTIREFFLSAGNIEKANYEKIYEEILNSNLSQSSKTAFNKLLFDTFLDEVDFYAKSPQWTDSAGFKSQNSLLEKFITKFCNSKNKSIFFTLNQDLFIERQLSKLFIEYNPERAHIKTLLNQMKIDTPAKSLKRPGVSDEITTKNFHTPIEGNLAQTITETNKNEAEKLFTDWLESSPPYTFYIKLHGSLDYLYNQMPLFITGENKVGRINSCPLTQYYSDIFEKLLLEHDCKLIVLGYGFQDEHINKAISKFIKSSNNNEIYLVDKSDMQQSLKKISDQIGNINQFKKILKGYFPNGLSSRTLFSFIEQNLLCL